MNGIYVLDACAVIAFLQNERGADKVVDVLKNARDEKCTVYMSAVNLVEVYYDIYRTAGKEKADEKIAMIKKLPLVINREITDKIFEEAGRLKASYKISFADAFALAQTIAVNGVLLTSDHHEFDVVEEKENMKFAWIR